MGGNNEAVWLLGLHYSNHNLSILLRTSSWRSHNWASWWVWNLRLPCELKTRVLLMFIRNSCLSIEGNCFTLNRLQSTCTKTNKNRIFKQKQVFSWTFLSVSPLQRWFYNNCLEQNLYHTVRLTVLCLKEMYCFKPSFNKLLNFFESCCLIIKLYWNQIDVF